MTKKLFERLSNLLNKKLETVDDSQILNWSEKLATIKTKADVVAILDTAVGGHVYGPKTHSFGITFSLIDNFMYSGLSLSADILIAEAEFRSEQILHAGLRLSGGSPGLGELFKTYFSDQVAIEVLGQNLCQSKLHLNFITSQGKLNVGLRVRQHRVPLLLVECNSNDRFLGQVDSMWVNCCDFENNEKNMLTFNFCNQQMTFYSFRKVVQTSVDDIKKYTDSEYFVVDRYKHSSSSVPFFKATFQNGLIKFLSVSGEVLAQFVVLK